LLRMLMPHVARGYSLRGRDRKHSEPGDEKDAG
jgi:hypothetical protein